LNLIQSVTQVHLQVFDGMCHTFTIFSFTKCVWARSCFKSFADCLKLTRQSLRMILLASSSKLLQFWMKRRLQHRRIQRRTRITNRM
jgi:hypothetical protein